MYKLINGYAHTYLRRSSRMDTSTRSRIGRAAAQLGLIGIIVLVAALIPSPMTALQTQQAANGYIQGTVRSSAGPEAGVWVIAETKDLATNLIKIVVTDDQGRYVLPQLPNANYSIW